MEFTKENAAKLEDYLAKHELSEGLGSKESACSVAAINLALNGGLTDWIPDCMSLVVGKWIIYTQDAMPSSIRNSAEWKALLPLAAGTGRNNEKARLGIIMADMWRVLSQLQPLADNKGFGLEWAEMVYKKTFDAAYAAANAANAANAAAYAAAAYAAANAAAYAAADAADASYASYASYAAYVANAANAAYAAYVASSDVMNKFWEETISPVNTLRMLVEA